jgi:hypothetical protein
MTLFLSGNCSSPKKTDVATLQNLTILLGLLSFWRAIWQNTSLARLYSSMAAFLSTCSKEKNDS